MNNLQNKLINALIEYIISLPFSLINDDNGRKTTQI
jgi:hypothetical protein